jgi:hypothetical protein
VTIGGEYILEVDGPLERPYRMQLGFGTGANFVPASRVLPGLDFDLPLPSSPGLEQTITYFGRNTLFTLESHSADTILWQGGDERFTVIDVFLSDLFKIPIDVPDLPASVLDFYEAGDLPAGFPEGAGAFTLRATFVPEPRSSTLVLAAALPIGIVAWRGRRRRTSGA